MALTKDGISNMEGEINNIKFVGEQIGNSSGELASGLKNDSNYQIFISGTEIGRELNEKLEKLIGLTKNLTENEVQNITKISNQFLKLQRDLNK